MSFTALWLQNGSFEKPQGCPFLKPVFVQSISNGHESWIMAERVLSQIQAKEMGFFPKSSQSDTSRNSAQW